MAVAAASIAALKTKLQEETDAKEKAEEEVKALEQKLNQAADAEKVSATTKIQPSAVEQMLKVVERRDSETEGETEGETFISSAQRQ